MVTADIELRAIHTFEKRQRDLDSWLAQAATNPKDLFAKRMVKETQMLLDKARITFEAITRGS